MIEELKELLGAIAQVPDMALNVFVLFGAYKIFIYLSTTAGIYGVIRLGINSLKETRLKELHIKETELSIPKTVDVKFSMFDMYSSDFERLTIALSRLKKDSISGSSYRSNYLDSDLINKVITEINRIASEK